MSKIKDKVQDAMQGYEDLTSPPASQSNVSIAKMLYLAPLLPVLYGLYLYGANTFLPPDDAARVKELVEVMVQVVGGVIGGGAPLALMYRSLKLTGKKLENQEFAQPQASQPSGGYKIVLPSTPPSLQLSTVDTSQAASEDLESAAQIAAAEYDELQPTPWGTDLQGADDGN